MANREENLKKINAELEQLNDEELEKVAGGTWALMKNLKKLQAELERRHATTENSLQNLI